MSRYPVPGQRDPSPKFQKLLDRSELSWPNVYDVLVQEWGYSTGFIDVLRGVREPSLYEATILALLLDCDLQEVMGS